MNTCITLSDFDLTSGCAWEIGGREEQQDAAAQIWTTDPKAVCLVVADGMGGHQSGDLASRIMVKHALDKFEQAGEIVDPELFLRDVLNGADAEIAQQCESRDIVSRTTVVIAISFQDRFFFCNVGDSRAYRINRDGVERLTKDDSVPEMLVAMGAITEDEMATHPDQGRLTNSIGAGTLEEDLRFGTLTMSGDQILLLCSDGFWETITKQDLSLLLDTEDFTAEIKRLCALATERGGKNSDNASVAAILLKAQTA